MVESWFIELAKGIGKAFLNPLLYWILILVFLAGLRRIKRERHYFGFKLFDVFSEWNGTWVIGLISGLVISIVCLGAGVVFSYGTILVLSILAIILSISLRFSLLSASYTIGISCFILLLLPVVPVNLALFENWFSKTNISGLVFLLAVMLIAEAMMIKRIRNNNTFPELVSGRRGMLIGVHHLKKIGVIPFFVLVPSGLITPFIPFWPYISMNGETYSLLLVPFLIGFDYQVSGSLPEKAAARISKSVLSLGVLVLLLAVGSIFIPWLSIIAVMLGIIGKELINFRHRNADQRNNACFMRRKKGIKILAVLPNSPADRLGVQVGDSIVKVSGQQVNSLDDFYYALQKNTFFKLELVDENGEARYVQSALYEGDHHELGIVTTAFRNYETEQMIQR
ncbi:PDZ domain-containing protein [Virgibacillus siamensis]|uniref:PDZ domain-containing protein n=1 Tax=Virgibacillus siamensis TaxID=480071 RepID=UPI0009871CAD|nr:PDZ domain-containing protein [Virgibacillus siamensis]